MSAPALVSSARSLILHGLRQIPLVNMLVSIAGAYLAFANAGGGG